MGIRRAIPTCVLALAVLAAPCRGQGDTAARKVFEDAWQAAREFKLAPGYVYEWDLLWHASLTDGELAALIAEVGKKPDHPKRRVMEAEQRRRAKGPDAIQRRLYYLDERRWRMNETNVTDSFFVDIASTPGLVWALGPVSLTLQDPDAPPPPNRDYVRTAEKYTLELRRFAWSGLGPVPYEEVRLLRAKLSGSGWIGQLAAYEKEFALEGVVVGDRLRIESSQQDRADAGSAMFGLIERYSDFKEAAGFPFPVAHRVRGFSAGERVQVAYVLRSVSPLSEDEFSVLSRVPEPGVADAVRGDVKFTSIVDFRRGAESITTKTPDGERVEAIPSAQLGRPASNSLRQVGWWSVAGIIAVLVGIRVWRSGRAP